jgi:hypothetical protein
VVKKSSCRVTVAFFLFFFLTTGTVSYSEGADSSLSGRLDSSFNVLSSHPGDANGDSALGLVYGDVSLTAGTKDVKSEFRVNLINYPVPTAILDRAWVKFRFSEVRGTMGLGRLGWGPGFVYVPGDLMFDSTSLSVNFDSDELRSSANWLGDAYLSLGEEAFAEAMVLSPAPQTIATNGVGSPFPGPASQVAGGIRVSASPGGVTLEGAAAVDGADSLCKIAVSTQFHALADWYSTVREDLPTNPGSNYTVGEGMSLGLGAFGLFDLGEGYGLSTRQEALLRPWHHWVPLDLRTLGSGTSLGVDPDSPPGSAGVGEPYALYTYHEVNLTMPENYILTFRALLSPVDASGLGIVQLSWAPLQELSLYVRGSSQFGTDSATYQWNSLGSIELGAGAVVVW